MSFLSWEILKVYTKKTDSEAQKNSSIKAGFYIKKNRVCLHFSSLFTFMSLFTFFSFFFFNFHEIYLLFPGDIKLP